MDDCLPVTYRLQCGCVLHLKWGFTTHDPVPMSLCFKDVAWCCRHFSLESMRSRKVMRSHEIAHAMLEMRYLSSVPAERTFVP